MNRIGVLGKRISAVVGLLILIIMVLDFNSRMAELTRLETQRNIESDYLQELKISQTALESAIGYAISENAVGKWAREEGRMILPGDHAIIPIAKTSDEVDTHVMGFEEVAPLSNWGAWFRWLSFDAILD